MGFLRNRLLRRLGPLGRIADVALVGGMAVRLAQRRGWMSDGQIDRMGLTGVVGGKSAGMGEIALAAGAALRLLRNRKRKPS